MSTSVILKRDVEPVFPQTCVACGRPATSHAWVNHEGDMGDAEVFGVGSIDVPTCKLHWLSIASGFWLRRFAIVATVLFGVFFIKPFLNDLNVFRGLEGVTFYVATILATLPLLIWMLAETPHFRSEASGGEIRYSFRSAKRAAEFVNANGNALLRYEPEWKPKTARLFSRRRKRRRK